jgi:hypothetical protein
MSGREQMRFFMSPRSPQFREDFRGGVSKAWDDWRLGAQWNNQGETPDNSPNVVLVDAPGRPGEKAWELTINNGDKVLQDDRVPPFGTDKERALLERHNEWYATHGTDWWYHDSIYIPASFNFDNSASPTTKWQIYMQFHSEGVTGGPQPVISLRHDSDGVSSEFFVRCGLIEQHGDIVGEEPNAGGETEQRTTFPIVRDSWTDVMLHIGWAVGNGNGYVDVFTRTGVETVYTAHPRMVVGTMYNFLPNYVSCGFYRGTAQEQTNTLYHGRIRSAKFREWLALPS